MLGKIVLTIAMSLPLCAGDRAGSADYEGNRLPRTVTVSLTAGFASTFQMVLGGTFGEGSGFQNKLTASVNNLLRNGDSLTTFGWSTTDLPTATPGWQAGATYKTRLRRKLTISGGAQRWVLPNVKTGAKDWLLSGNFTYNVKIAAVRLVLSDDSWSLLKSTLPRGSANYTQVYTQHRLVNREEFELTLRQGPAYTYAMGFYGAEGNRVMRYGGSLVGSWRGNTIEAGYRQQFGLQDKIPWNRYWSFAVTRQITKRL